MKRCDKCGKDIKSKEKRFLIYEHQYITELKYRICEECFKDIEKILRR
jgi:hypothetical protein